LRTPDSSRPKDFNEYVKQLVTKDLKIELKPSFRNTKSKILKKFKIPQNLQPSPQLTQ